MAELAHDFAVKFHLSAEHAAVGRSEIHHALPHAEPTATAHIDNCMVATAALLCCRTVWQLRNPDLSEEATRRL